MFVKFQKNFKFLDKNVKKNNLQDQSLEDCKCECHKNSLNAYDNEKIIVSNNEAKYI